MSQQHIVFEDHSSGIQIARVLEQKIIDESTVELMGNQLYEQVSRRALIVDFSLTEYISATFLAKLVTANNRLRRAEGLMILCGVRPDIYEVFTQTLLNKVFTIEGTAEAAIERAHIRGYT